MNKKEINPDDEVLVKMIQENDDMYAMEILIKRYQNMVYNVCYNLTGNQQDALDCAQDTFVKLYENIKSFKQLSSFKTWIYTIAVNTCKNHLKSFRYRLLKKTISVEEGIFDIEDCSMSPADHYRKKRIQEIVQCAINRLPFDQRHLIILRDIQQLSYEEIEKITSLPSGTIKSKISRARNKLKELLKDIKDEL